MKKVRLVFGIALIVVGNMASVYAVNNEYWLGCAGAILLCGAGGWFLGGKKQ